MDDLEFLHQNEEFMKLKAKNSKNNNRDNLSPIASLSQDCFNNAKKVRPPKVAEKSSYQVLRTLNVPKRYKSAKITDYAFDDIILNKYLRLLKKATDYGRGLNLLGVNGVGKTRFIHALIREYVLLNADESFEECKKSIKVVKFIEIYKNLYPSVNDKYIDMLKKVDLLVIDDFLKINLTELQLAYIIDVLDYRYEAMKPTITTANVTTEEMSEKCGKTLWDRINNINYSKEIIEDSLRPKYDNLELKED